MNLKFNCCTNNLHPLNDSTFSVASRKAPSTLKIAFPVLRFNSVFVGSIHSSLNLLAPQRLSVETNWVERLTVGYFPSHFSLVNFSSTKSVIFHVKSKHAVSLITFFKHSWWSRSTILIDCFANDYIARTNRFEITYCLLSPKRNERLYFRAFAHELAVMRSISHLYKSANWLEREI